MANERVKKVIDTLVAEVQNSPDFTKLDPRVRKIVNEATEFTSTAIGPDLVNKVDLESNFQLNEIPAKAIGPFNPVELVTGDISATDVKSTLNGVVQSKLSKSISDQITNEIFDKINEELPDSLKSFVDLNVISSEIGKVINDATGISVSETLDSYSRQIFDLPLNLPPFVDNVAGAFLSNPLDIDAALNQVKLQATGVIAQKAISSARKFKVLSDENEQKLVTNKQGFIDPTGTYPTQIYANEAETNKLARGEVVNTVIQVKEKNRSLSNKIAGGSFDEPPSFYKAVYPYNKVTETESGHIIEIDDSPNAERLHIYHKSGTFIEIDAFGNVNKKTKGSDYQFVEKNGYLSVKGNMNVSIGKGIRVFIGGDADLEIQGDTNITCRNDITMQAAGRIDMSATEEINFYSANINMHANTDVSIKGEKNAYITSNNIYTLANVSTYNQAGTNYNVKAGNRIFKDAPNIRMNEGLSSDSKVSRSANIGSIGLRQDKEEGEILESFPNNYLDQFLDSEDAEDESVAIAEYDLKNRSGLLNKDILETPAIAIDVSNPTSSVNDIITPEDFVQKQESLPENFQLSPNFTLGSLSTRAAFPHEVVSQKGFSYGDIVYNLQAVALNVLEPVYSMYPNLIITSGFRPIKPTSSPTSDHLVGKAVDLQFIGAAKEEYYGIAEVIATNLNFDKLLLEYKDDGTGNPWIHISFDLNRQRKLILTYNNHRLFSSGLNRLI